MDLILRLETSSERELLNRALETYVSLLTEEIKETQLIISKQALKKEIHFSKIIQDRIK